MKVNDLFDLVIWSILNGGFGALAGGVGGALSAVFLMFGSDPFSCSGELACDDQKLWLVTMAVIGGALGVILGALLGLGAKKLSAKFLDPKWERVATVAGGLAGGVAPWGILWLIMRFSKP